MHVTAVVIIASLAATCAEKREEKRAEEEARYERRVAWLEASSCRDNFDGPSAKVPPGLVPKPTSGLSKSDVWQTISKRQRPILRCYEARLAEEPGLHGKVVYQWTVQTDGTVAGACIEEKTLSSPELESCVLGVIEDLRFPEPAGAEVIIVYPFFFQTR